MAEMVLGELIRPRITKAVPFGTAFFISHDMILARYQPLVAVSAIWSLMRPKPRERCLVRRLWGREGLERARSEAERRRQYAVIPTDNRVESRRHSGHAPLAEGVFIDFETSEGRAMDVAASAAGLTLQFENLQPAKWRNFEFRFDDIVNNGSMTALIRMVGSTHFDPALPNQNALLVVREYDENYKWSDTILDVPFRLSSKTGEQIALIDLYPVLSDARLRHRFGLLVFLPEQVTRVEIAEMEAFVYDRRTAGNSAP